MRLVFSGSFDPITSGHLNVIRRGAKLCDELVVCAFVNKEKKSRYPIEIRKEMIKRSVLGLDNVTVDAFEGLLAEYCKKVEADAVLRGIRSVKDFEYEREMALINYCKLGVETIFIISEPGLSYVSSSSVREMLAFGADVKGFVPDEILDVL